jgi:hypothetical protein
MPYVGRIGALQIIMNYPKNVRNEYAVSEVIGVILIVAVTVILAALIGSLAISMIDSHMQKPKFVAVSVKQVENNDIQVIYLGGSDDTELEYMVIIDPSGNRLWTISTDGQLAAEGSGSYDKPNVGAVMTLHGVGTIGYEDHIIVAGQFTDGAALVLSDTWV